MTSTNTRNALIALIAAVLLVAALKASYAVSMPIAAAIFVIAVAWPVKPARDRLMPSTLSEILTLVLLAIMLAVVFVGIYFTILDIVETVTAREEEFRALVERYQRFAERYGLPTFDGQSGYDRLVSVAHTVGTTTYSALGYLGLIMVLVVLGLPEVAGLQRRVQACFPPEVRERLDGIAEDVARHFRSYLGVTLITSLLTGVATAGWVWAMGVDLAVTWGMLNFLLNFVPVLGILLGAIPPTLFALVQFEDPQVAAGVGIGLFVIQIVIGNFVYPMLQGQGMSMPSVLVVLALTFWSWVWGVAGALLAVPLTSAALLVFGRFEATAWITHLMLTDHEAPDRTTPDPAAQPARADPIRPTQIGRPT